MWRVMGQTSQIAGILLLSLALTSLFLNTANANLNFSLAASTAATVKSPDVVFNKGNVPNSATIFTRNSSAIVTTTTTTTYVASGVNVVTGSYQSGTVPTSVSTVDSNYYVVKASGSPKTAETEFTFAPTSTSPTQLNFTIVENYDTASVNVTIQVYNYTGAKYSPCCATGYLSYISSITPSTDQSKSISIASNPQFFTQSGTPQAKVKILASIVASSYNQNFNLITLGFYPSTATYDYVLDVVNQAATTYTIRLNSALLTSSNINRLSNFTAWFHAGSSSVQIQILSGSFATQTGPFYTLSGTTSVHLAIRVTATSPGGSTVDCYLQVYLPSTTTYANYRLTFKV